MTTTVQDIIKGAFRLLGVTVSGENPTTDEMNDALSALNQMLAHWATERLNVTSLTSENFPLTSGVVSYTIGTGQTFNTAKPIRINSAFVRDTINNIDYPVNVIGLEQYNSFSDKLIASGIPEYLYYDTMVTQQTTQIGTIYIYPSTTSNSSYKLYLESLKQFVEFASLTEVITFPTYYLRPIKYNLAIEIANEYGRGITPEIYNIATESLKSVKNVNSKQIVSGYDFGKARSFNIYSGDY